MKRSTACAKARYRERRYSFRMRVAERMATHRDNPSGADMASRLQAQLERTSGESCKRIDTHAATIILCGDRAWKVKRPVHLPYLDFSSPKARKAALQAELDLNRRTAPDLYLAVHAITCMADGAIAFDRGQMAQMGCNDRGA